MDPVSVWFGSTLFVYATSNISVDDKNIHFLVCALRVNKCALCVYRYDFHEMHARLRGPNYLFILHQIINRTSFPLFSR